MIGDRGSTKEILDVCDPKRRRVTEVVKVSQNETRASEDIDGPRWTVKDVK